MRGILKSLETAMPIRLDFLRIAKRGVGLALTIALMVALSPSAGPGGETTSPPRKPPTDPCPRYAPGSVINNPPNIFSHNGVLRVTLLYNTETDADGRTLFCFMTPNGKEAPTLHVHPGGRLIMKIINNLPAPLPGQRVPAPEPEFDVCGAASEGPDSVNVHFHGTNTSPACHQDDVIHTLINSGQTFTYNLKFPKDEPPGLYWYHPHVHGLADAAVQGGASGALVVNGLERIQPAVAGLRERIFNIRDQNVAGEPPPGGPNNVPSWDVAVNYVPVPYPSYTPGILEMKPGKKELWRVVNASADTQLDLQVQYDGVPQTLEVVGYDGVPAGSQDGTRRGKLIPMTDIFVPCAGRVEFIVKGPSKDVKNATFLTLNVDTGPIGDVDPTRPLATIETTGHPKNGAVARNRGRGAETSPNALVMPAVSGPPWPQRFEGLADAQVTATRNLYFSEVITDERDPEDWLNTQFYITVDGATPELFNPDNPPAIVTTQGSVEDWTIASRSTEVHEFHIHQIHFLLLAVNGVPVPPAQQQFYDTYQVPYWSGSGPYPSITVRMDFRGPDIGDFVYHCHILAHEDGGMMAIIRVLPQKVGWFGPYGKIRTLLASIPGPWQAPPQTAPWCVYSRAVQWNKYARYTGLEAVELHAPMLAALRRRRDAVMNWRRITGISSRTYAVSREKPRLPRNAGKSS
ncbi:MAG: multicopper oxidase family protein [Candidatus Binataceae bacterium]